VSPKNTSVQPMPGGERPVRWFADREPGMAARRLILSNKRLNLVAAKYRRNTS
jgi:hypothetical protein